MARGRWGPLVALIGALGCGDCGDDDGRGGATDAGRDRDADVIPTGDAALRFRATWGATARMQIEAGWRDDVPGWEADATLLLLLCDRSDPICEAPVLAREISAGEHDGVAIAPEDGPTVTVERLPEGDFLAVVMADSTSSRARGFAWNDGFDTTERAWGGYASEGDLLVSAAEDPAGAGHNPAVAPVAVTLGAGGAADLGDLILGHYHERDISPPPATDAATLVLAVDEGLRLVDLGTHAFVDAGGADGVAVMTRDGTAGGAPVEGTVCGLVRGPAHTVFLLYRDAAGGFAIQYDVASKSQLNAGFRVNLPGAGDTPCRGIYHQFDGAPYLFVTNALAAADRPAADGLWYARIDRLYERDVDAVRIAGATYDAVLGAGVDSLAAHEDRIFLGITPAAGDSRFGSGAQGRHIALVGTLAADGRPTLRDPVTDARQYLLGPAQGAAWIGPAGTVVCDAPVDTTAITVAPFHDGRTLLFLGGCLEVAAFDLDATPVSRLDFDGPVPGEPNLDGTLHGQGFGAFALSPDRGRLWALPQRPSPFPFFVPTGDGAPIRLDRRMALPIDLSTGALPSVDTSMAVDVDGYEGHPAGGPATPGIDPGLDLGYVSYQRYLLDWAPSLGGETFAPALDLDGILGAAGSQELFVVSPTGMGKAQDVGTYAVGEATGHLWPRAGEPYYGIWTGGPDVTPAFGFDADPAADTTPIHGVAVVR